MILDLRTGHLSSSEEIRTTITKKEWCYAADAHSAVSRGSTGTRVAVQFTSNAPADSPVRTTLQRHRRLARLPSRPVHVSAPAYNATVDSPVCTGLPRRGRLTRERLQLHLAIINFMADYFRPGTSGDNHLKNILLVHIIILSKSSLSLSWSAILLMQDNCSLHQNDVVNSPVRAVLHGRFICLSHL